MRNIREYKSETDYLNCSLLSLGQPSKADRIHEETLFSPCQAEQGDLSTGGNDDKFPSSTAGTHHKQELIFSSVVEHSKLGKGNQTMTRMSIHLPWRCHQIKLAYALCQNHFHKEKMMGHCHGRHSSKGKRRPNILNESTS